MVKVKLCVNCYYGEVHHNIGAITYCNCTNGQNQHPEKKKTTKTDDGMVFPAMLDLKCWEPKKE